MRNETEIKNYLHTPKQFYRNISYRNMYTKIYNSKKTDVNFLQNYFSI